MSHEDLINKIQLLKSIQPQKDWVVSCRSRLALRMEMERKKDLLEQKTLLLRGIFSHWEWLKIRPNFGWIYGFAAGVLVLIGTGGLTAWAAVRSLPGGPLYPMKIVLEKVRLAVTSPEKKIQLQAEMVNQRLVELKRVVESLEPIEVKKEKMGQVVGHIQEQMATFGEQLPQNSGKSEPQKAVSTAKIVTEQASQIKKAVAKAKESLPGQEAKKNLAEKLSEVAESADKTEIKALAIMAEQQNQANSLEKKEVLAKVEEKIQEAKDKIKTVVDLVGQATSTPDKLSVRAVLVKDQSEKAQELLKQAKESLNQEDAAGALRTMTMAKEIINGAEKIVEMGENQDTTGASTPSSEK